MSHCLHNASCCIKCQGYKYWDESLTAKNLAFNGEYRHLHS